MSRNPRRRYNRQSTIPVALVAELRVAVVALFTFFDNIVATDGETDSALTTTRTHTGTGTAIIEIGVEVKSLIVRAITVVIDSITDFSGTGIDCVVVVVAVNCRTTTLLGKKAIVVRICTFTTRSIHCAVAVVIHPITEFFCVGIDGCIVVVAILSESKTIAIVIRT